MVLIVPFVTNGNCTEVNGRPMVLNGFCNGSIILNGVSLCLLHGIIVSPIVDQWCIGVNEWYVNGNEW